MFIDLTPEQRKFRDELRAYFEEIIPPELFEELRGNEGGGPIYRRTLKRMAKDGLLGLGWPKAYGGQERPLFDQFIFADEVQAAGFPLPFLTLNTVGPTLMRFGTDTQKTEYLPRILAGDCHFAIGYSEPEAGTDLASLKTRAERDGDHYIINGSKIFTSLADYSDYIWLAARTGPAKHKGISMFIVPTNAPGFSCTPIHTIGGIKTNSTFYEDVRVPAANLVGEENMGWTLITNQLNHERLALSGVAGMARLLEEVLDWARETKLADGRRVIDQPWVQTRLAWLHAKTEALKLMNWKLLHDMQNEGQLGPAGSSTVKVYSSEFAIEACRSILEIFGQEGYLKEGSPGAVLRGRVEMRYRTSLILTFGGGTNEIQRDIIAMAGLGLPHYKD
jgi:alkylation response protein AidB-like acyl-CoA dehydrogenase